MFFNCRLPTGKLVKVRKSLCVNIRAGTPTTARTARASTGTRGTQPEKQKNNKKPFNWAGSWIWKAAAAVLGTVCIALLIGMSTTPRMPTGNIVLHLMLSYSIIVTAAKAVILALVTSCISQLKWNQYQSPARLHHMPLLDQASRGPWGALEAIWSMTPGLAILGGLAYDTLHGN